MNIYTRRTNVYYFILLMNRTIWVSHKNIIRMQKEGTSENLFKVYYIK